MNADIANCECNYCKWLKAPEIVRRVKDYKWASDRLLSSKLLLVPDYPVFWIPYFALLGNFWIIQTKFESTDSYLGRCYEIFRKGYAHKYSEAEFVKRVVLGLRSFSWACYTRKVQTFRAVFEVVIVQLESHNLSLSYAPWSRFLFPGEKKVSERLIKSYLCQVALLRKAIKPPSALINEVVKLFNQSVEELRGESGGLVLPKGELRRAICERVRNNALYKEKIQPYINHQGLYGSQAYLPRFHV